MAPELVALVVAAAVLHVAWNVLLKGAGDPLRTAAGAMVTAALVSVPIGLAVVAVGGGSGSAPVDGPIEGTGPSTGGPLVTVALIALVSGLVEAIYLVLLSAAYRRGSLSVVYPTARGTAPLVATLVGVGLLGERLAGPGALGVVLLLGGLVVLVRPWQIVARGRGALEGGPLRDPAHLAVATGVAIAGYTALDRVAVRLIDPWLYGALVWPAMAIWTLLAVAVVGRRWAPLNDADPAVLDGRGRAIAAGLFSYAAYGLVLAALSVAPLTAVAPLRESAIVLASGWGVLRMREAVSWPEVAGRLGAAMAVVAGAVLLVFD